MKKIIPSTEDEELRASIQNAVRTYETDKANPELGHVPPLSDYILDMIRPHLSGSTSTEGIPYMTPAPSTEVEELTLREGLERIAEGAGAYNRDPLIHAGNCIEEMKAIARALLTHLTAPPKPEGEAEVIALRSALRNMADAYVRKVKTGLAAEEIAREPWRCAEYIEAERLCKVPFKLHFTKEWLIEKIKNDPDLPCEVGPLHRPAPPRGEKEE